MEPKRGDEITILFKNGMVEHGIVLTWGDNKSTIKSVNSNNVVIILNTINDVMAVKIHMEEKQKHDTPKILIEDELKPDKYYDKESLRAKSLVELYKERSNEERNRARALVTSFEHNGLSGPSYDPKRTTLPRKLQHSIPHYPQKKT